MASRPLPIKDCFLSSKIPCSAKPHVIWPIQYKNWSSKDLELVCKAVSIGLLIRDQLKNPRLLSPPCFWKGGRGANSGQQKYLRYEEEEKLMKVLLGSVKIGYPRTCSFIGSNFTYWKRSKYQCDRCLIGNLQKGTQKLLFVWLNIYHMLDH